MRRDEIFRLKKKKSSGIYRETYNFIQLENTKCKKIVHFEMNLYFMKLNFNLKFELLF